MNNTYLYLPSILAWYTVQWQIGFDVIYENVKLIIRTCRLTCAWNNGLHVRFSPKTSQHKIFTLYTDLYTPSPTLEA